MQVWIADGCVIRIGPRPMGGGFKSQSSFLLHAGFGSSQAVARSSTPSTTPVDCASAVMQRRGLLICWAFFALVLV